MFDVIVIGAGPCGTAAAYDLLSAGLSVLIVDRVRFPRKKACAGGITPKAYALFRYDISPMVKRICHRVRIRGKNGLSFDVKNKSPLCYMTRRSELDAFSLGKVMQKGGAFKVISKIESIEENADSVEIKTRCGSYKARFLIGADGANSRVRKLIETQRFWQYQPALEADVHLKNAGAFPMEFDFSRRDKGYFWIFPKDDHVNIGIYGVGRSVKIMRAQLAAYAQEKFGTGEIHDIKGYPICTGGYAFRPTTQRILLAGDAAGLAERLLGEGIYFAVKSGQVAARAIVKGFECDLPSTSGYYHQQLRRMRIDLRLHHLSSLLLYSFTDVSLAMSSVAALHRPFAKGYAEGRTLSEILF